MARLEILGGELSIVPPIAAKLEPNRPESVMGAAPATSAESIVRMRDDDHHIAAVFRRMWLACDADPAGAFRTLADHWRADEGDAELVTLANGAALFMPKQPYREGKITSLGAILVCAGASGVVSANVMVEGDVAPARHIMTSLAESIEKGSHPANTLARQASIEACGETLLVDTPARFVEREELGMDFSVFRFRKVGSLTDDVSFAIYVGSHPTTFAPSTATDVKLSEGITARRWDDGAGVHLERIEERAGCIVHAFARGAATDESVLRGLIAFRRR